MISRRHKEEIKMLLQEKVSFFGFLDNKEREMILTQTVKSTYSRGKLYSITIG